MRRVAVQCSKYKLGTRFLSLVPSLLLLGILFTIGIYIPTHVPCESVSAWTCKAGEPFFYSLAVLSIILTGLLLTHYTKERLRPIYITIDAEYGHFPYGILRRPKKVKLSDISSILPIRFGYSRGFAIHYGKKAHVILETNLENEDSLLSLARELSGNSRLELEYTLIKNTNKEVARILLFVASVTIVLGVVNDIPSLNGNRSVALNLFGVSIMLCLVSVLIYVFGNRQD